MATTNPFQFIQQVRAEVAKVVWPTRREVILAVRDCGDQKTKTPLLKQSHARDIARYPLIL